MANDREEIQRIITTTMSRFASDFRTPEKVFEHVAEEVKWWMAGNTATGGTKSKREMIAIVAALPQLSDTGLAITLTGWVIEGNKAAVEGTGEIQLKDGRRYTNQYHFLFELAGGKIIAVKEYLDTAAVRDIFG